MTPRLLLLAVLGCLWCLLPKAARADEKIAWSFRERDCFHAEVISFTGMLQRLGAVPSDHALESRILSKDTVEKVAGDKITLRKTILALEDRSTSPLPSHLKQLEGLELIIVLNRDMEVIKVDGFEPVLGAFLGTSGGREISEKQKEDTRELLTRTIKNSCIALFPKLPQRAVAEGESWPHALGRLGAYSVNQDRTYIYRGNKEKGDLHRIEVTGRNRSWQEPGQPAEFKEEISGEQFKGFYLYDAALGRVTEGNYFWTYTSNARVPRPAGSSISGMREICEHVQCRITVDEPKRAVAAPRILAVALARDPLDKLSAKWTNSVGMEFVKIPAGTFTMGSREIGRTEIERPWEVQLTKPYFMAVHEVTIGDYRKFVKETGYQTIKELSGLASPYVEKLKKRPGIQANAKFTWDNPGWDVNDRHPAVWLSWVDAKAYCAWLSKKEGKPYRLPTEAEWEHACRAGTKTTYYAGDDAAGLAKIANLLDQSAKLIFPEFQASRENDGNPFTAPVGSFAPNAFGLYDILGNAAEWCEDWLFYYPQGSGIDPVGPPLGKQRVLRGGGFLESTNQVGAGFRSFGTAHYHTISTGFRVVLSSNVLPDYEPTPNWIGKSVVPRDPVLVNSINADNSMPFSLPWLKVVDEDHGVMLLQNTHYANKSIVGIFAKDDFMLATEAVAYYTKLLKAEQTPQNHLVRAAAYHALGEHDKAMSDLDAAIKLEDRDSWYFHLRGKLRNQRKQYAQALEDFEKALDLRASNPYLLSAVAWHLATCPDSAIRDGKRATELASQAVQISRRLNGEFLDTAAAAHAEAGDFEQAVQYQKEANLLYQVQAVIEERHRLRLETYEAKKPHRE